jgi:predicted DNA binding CopG/RHH family protein
MSKDPHISTYMDEDERELAKAIEAEDYEPGDSLLTPELVKDLQEAARNTLSEVSTKVSIRIPRSDLARVKARALREGIPYQTLIKSIIHQAVSG